MGFGEYLDQIIRSHLTVAESTELTIKVSYFMKHWPMEIHEPILEAWGFEP